MAPTQLQIKVKALGRLIKEEKLYNVEYEEQEQVIEKMKEEKADEYELKKQIEVLEDTGKMIPQLHKKIKEASSSLQAYLETFDGEEDLSEAQENIDKAEKLLN